MKPSARMLGLALAAVAAAGSVALHRAFAADGLPDASGQWEGKVAYKDAPLESDNSANKGAFGCTLSWSQEGSSFTAVLAVNTDEGVQQFPFAGVIGNGNFWGSNNDAVSPLLVSGRVSGPGSGTKMKMHGILVSDTDITDIKISLKRAPVTL